MISPARQLFAEHLAVSPSSASWGVRRRSASIGETETPREGEIFAIPAGLLILSLEAVPAGGGTRFREGPNGGIERVGPRRKSRWRIQATAFVHTDATEELDWAQVAVSELLGVELTPFKYRNSRFAELAKEVVTEELPSDEAHLKIANGLVKRGHRTMAVAVKSSRGLLGRDAQRHAPAGVEADAVLADLVEAGIAEGEVVVVCRTSGNQVARVPNEDSLKRLAAEGLRCACGRPIDEESPEQLYTSTAAANLLLDKSRWMSVLVRQKLIDLGVPAEDVLLECQLGSDEIDCLALVSGEILAMELKDKDFSIGNAYSFGAKVSIVEPRHAVIVTTEGVGGDVKAHFSRTSSPDRRRYAFDTEERQTIHYIEGGDFLEQLAPIIENIYVKDGATILDAALPLAVIKAESVVSALRERS